MLFLLYINPKESPEAHLLSEAHREDTARMVNSAILASQLQDQGRKPKYDVNGRHPILALKIDVLGM